ncbi:uncharacterized protein LOC128744334 isoform X2 [Sabethes cyaneus]|uniref:uncharacterized protein LOC128744334 isoform X2 n=1 Tax=Sabethes cyaneus TaxID=53552 RepID=UPI00237D878E|nr:uncharacterized protein LOC128744334 isoform X2 [Sabethes cyaneus]
MSANDSLSECCRCCMLQKDGLVHLFVKLEEFGRPISDLIFSCSGVMVSNDDCLPQNICKACLDDLTIAARFQDRCRQSDTFLRNESIPVQNTDEMTPIESILIKIEHTDDDDDDEKSTHYTEQSFSDASLWSNLESQYEEPPSVRAYGRTSAPVRHLRPQICHIQYEEPPSVRAHGRTSAPVRHLR